MWTPRRIGLLAAGLLCYLTCYFGYARSFLGAIDGLPGLPEEYRRPAPGDVPSVFVPRDKPKPVEEKLKLAFGRDCPELGRPIKLELHSRSMVLAAAEFQLTPDGRARFRQISVALFGKDKGDGHHPEINTLRGNVAFLKFDRPVQWLSDISTRKVTEAELNDQIEVVNNRRSEERTDDISLYIHNGPLYFSEEKHQIWTHDVIHLKDVKSKPKPIEIFGTGMVLDLLTDAPPAKPGQRKPKQESITGVKRIVLNANVLMYLYVDSQSSFPAGGREEAGSKGERKPSGAPAAPAVEEKAQIKIKTPGRFTYEFGKEKEDDLATFEANQAGRDSLEPPDVHVERRQPGSNAADQLNCEKLVLRLRRRNDDDKNPAKPAGPAGSGPEQNLQIETAHATGTEVILTSDAENLEAHCIELIHNSRTMTTFLRGDPKMWACKDGHVIHARELQIQEEKVPADRDNPEGKKFQRVNARGPGQVDLAPDKTNKNKKPLHAVWQDRLTTSRDGPHTLLTLTGQARFEDDEHDQYLQAETLKVWLEERPAPAGKPAQPPPSGAGEPPLQQKTRPHHLEGLTDVEARSPEMNLHKAARLVVWFKDVPPETILVTPGQGVAPSGNGRGTMNPPRLEGQPRIEGPARPGSGSEPAPSGASVPAGPEKKAPPRPIDLTARQVEAWVLRSESNGETRNVLDKLYTEGNVHVVQDPDAAKPDEKGVDIQGEWLQLTYHPDGHHLVVGGPSDLAQVRMDKIYILGPEVNIDQAANKVWVTGVGAMQLESNQTPSGTPISKSVPLVIHWNQSMLFNGKFAEFHGGIQATQENARLTCQSMVVWFDRPISLKQGNPSDKPAKVEKLLCDRSVCIEDSTQEGNRLVKWQQITGVAVEVLTLENDEEDQRLKTPAAKASRSDSNQITTAGPGTVRIFQPGSNDPLASPDASPQPGGAPGPKAASRTDEVMKLTYIAFRDRMSANNQTNKANFWGNVQVLNLPSDSPQRDVDLVTLLDNMPRDAFYLSCDQLMVMTRKENGRTSQEMEARHRVLVKAREFSGRCDRLTFNEAKDQIILFGTDNEPAYLWRVIAKGAEPDQAVGKKIIYIRSTGHYQVDGGKWMSGR